jgi:hypothetical protein
MSGDHQCFVIGFGLAVISATIRHEKRAFLALREEFVFLVKNKRLPQIDRDLSGSVIAYAAS